MPESTDATREALRLWLASHTLDRPADDALGLLEAAREQGLMGLMQGALADAWAPEARARLREAQRAALVRGVRQLELAARAQALLLDRGLRALPLKGAAVAETLYESVAERPMSDVDLLALDDCAAAQRALVGAGFREGERADHATSLSDPATGFVLELHRSVTSCPGLFPLDVEGLWARSRPGPGQVPRLPGPEDLLLHLALHAAFQHGGVLSLVQYLDLRRALERQAIDPARLLAIAAAARAEGPLAAALLLAERIVGAPVPQELHAALAHALPGRQRRWLRASAPLSFVTPAEPDTLRMRLALTRGRRLALLARTLAPLPAAEVAPAGTRAWRAIRRAAGLARRWGPPTLRRAMASARPRS